MNKKILTILTILLLIALITGVVLKMNGPDAKEGELSEKQVASLVKKVGKLINVPEETPVIATITNIDELVAQQKFYAGAENGDYLIVFPSVQKALIYREGENRLINVGPIIVEPEATTTQKPKVEKKAEVSTTTASSSTDEE